MDDTVLAMVILGVAALMVFMGWRTLWKAEEEDQKADGRWTHRG